MAVPRPNKQENPFYIELYSALRHSLKKIDFKKNFENRNIIFFPEVFRDKRVKYLQKIFDKNFKKVAIFYDANVLRNPKITPPNRLSNFRNYLDFIVGCDLISCISNETKDTLLNICKSKNISQRTSVHYLPVEAPSKSFNSVRNTAVEYSKEAFNIKRTADLIFTAINEEKNIQHFPNLSCTS